MAELIIIIVSFTLIKAQFFALNTAAKRTSSDEMEATRHHAHKQRRRLEVDDCDCTVCTSLTIHFRWEETPSPTTLPCSCSPHNVLHLPSYWASVSEPHTCDFNAAFSLLLYVVTRPLDQYFDISFRILYTQRAHPVLSPLAGQ